jgi:hypothetical protein
MKQVYEDRAKTIGAKQMLTEEEKWRMEYEKKLIEEEINRIKTEDEEKKMRETLTKKNHQTDILKQINERDRE